LSGDNEVGDTEEGTSFGKRFYSSSSALKCGSNWVCKEGNPRTRLLHGLECKANVHPVQDQHLLHKISRNLILSGNLKQGRALLNKRSLLKDFFAVKKIGRGKSYGWRWAWK
jgi:hypothetical protein